MSDSVRPPSPANELGESARGNLDAPHSVELTSERLTRLLIAATPSTARQSHGFVFQSGVSRLLSLYVPASYTDEVDAYSIKQPHDEVMRHSFKNMKMGSAVELGDLARNAHVTRDFAMYVGFWAGFKTNIREVFVMNIRADYWRSLFPKDIGPFTAEQAFDAITNSADDDEKWTTRLTVLKKLWEQEKPEGSPATVNFKRDHKTQRRVQCGIATAGFPSLFAELFDADRTKQLEGALDGERVSPV